MASTSRRRAVVAVLLYDHALIDGEIPYTESHMTASCHNDRHDTKD